MPWVTLPISCLNLAGHLLDLYDDEFSRFQGCKAHQNIDNPEVDIRLWCRFTIAFDKVSLFGGRSLESPLPEKAMHEGTDIEPDLRPQGLVIRLENDPFGASVKAFLDKEGDPPHRDVRSTRG